jgi:hypothetical protein
MAKTLNIVSQPSNSIPTIHNHANCSSSVTIPCLILASMNAYNLWVEHWEHWDHMPPLEERVQYPYQNLRTKNYFWGDGDKTLL